MGLYWRFSTLPQVVLQSTPRCPIYDLYIIPEEHWIALKSKLLTLEAHSEQVTNSIYPVMKRVLSPEPWGSFTRNPVEIYTIMYVNTTYWPSQVPYSIANKCRFIAWITGNEGSLVTPGVQFQHHHWRQFLLPQPTSYHFKSSTIQHLKFTHPPTPKVQYSIVIYYQLCSPCYYEIMSFIYSPIIYSHTIVLCTTYYSTVVSIKYNLISLLLYYRINFIYPKPASIFNLVKWAH